MQYIYSRVSTDKQNTFGQLSFLTSKYPNAQVIEETASGGKNRPLLNALINTLKPGDELIVAALDRLGRKTVEIITLIETIHSKGIILKSLREGIDYSTPTGKFITQVLCMFAELERNLISQRTKAALDAKRKQGIVGGRPRVHKPKAIADILSLKGHATIKEIAALTGLPMSTVHYHLSKTSTDTTEKNLKKDKN